MRTKTKTPKTRRTIRNSVNALILFCLSTSAYAYTLTKDTSSGTIYINSGDNKPMRSSPLIGLFNGDTMLPIVVDSQGRLLCGNCSGGGGSTVDQGVGNGGSSPWSVSGTVTANIGTTGGLALDSSLSTLNTTLGSPFQSGGSIGNTSFGVSGLLPAFAATPTFNVGTTGGIALDSTLSALSAKFNSLGQKTMAGSAPVVIASDQSAIPVTGSFTVTSGGKDTVALARHDYSSANVTTSAYTTLVASLTDDVTQLFIFDSSGRTLVVAVGAAASEVDQAYIVPGGNGELNLAIASGERVSIKAVSANATKGELNVTFLK